jgi:metal-responsive CopG/Arc/MetJ family transcriptional regulator
VGQTGMIVTSVALTPDLARRARIQAAIEGKSRSQLVREALEQLLADPSRPGEKARPTVCEEA